MTDESKATAGEAYSRPLCSTCIFFHREEKRWITWDWFTWTTGRWFKKEHSKPVETHHFALLEECRRFPRFEPRNRFDTCGEHTSNTKVEAPK